MSLYEKQKKIYPRSVHGWFARWRWALVWLTQLLFYGLPWLMWNGRQAVLFELTSRRFYIFEQYVNQKQMGKAFGTEHSANRLTQSGASLPVQ